MNNPSISFVMAACKRRGYAMAGLESLKSQTRQDWELIVSPDDGGDYREMLHADSRVRVVRSAAMQAGPAHARNRALVIASGTLVAVLDDDDYLEPAFVAQAVAHFKSASETFATTATRYFLDSSGFTVRHIGQFPAMGIDQFGLQFGTMHAIGRREIYPQWKPGFAEDVMHTCKCIDLAGGEIAVLPDASYGLRIHPESLCALADSHYISQSYRDLATDLPYEMSKAGTLLTQQLLLRRIQMNEAFSDHRGHLGYHEFVKRHRRSFLPTVD